jgi:DNA polymerase
MFVGEGPGEREDCLARPFVGKSGELLDAGLESNGLSRDDVYIANIVKCRPPGNRNPTPREMGTCAPFLYRQIEVIQPTCIVALGKIAAEYITDQKIAITRERGCERRSPVFPDIFIIPTLHPAYILRNNSNRLQDLFFRDIGWALDLSSSGLTPAEYAETIYQDWMESNKKYWEESKTLWQGHHY